MKHLPPAVDGPFTCVHCGTFADHYTHRLWIESGSAFDDHFTRSALTRRTCHACSGETLFHDGEFRWPTDMIGPPAHDRLPDEIRATYDEAREIGGRSPRAAAALLRLALQQLLRQLGHDNDINTATGKLVDDGLPRRIQQAMDVLRVAGNNAVHEGAILLGDDADVVNSLFVLVNLVVEDRIATPGMIDELYELLPESKREQIDRRDRRV